MGSAPSRRGRFLSASVLGACFSITPIGIAVAAQATPTQFMVKGQNLPSILHELEARGHQFIYSSDLVHKRLTLKQKPAGKTDIECLQNALRVFGLALKKSTAKQPGPQVWLIVPLPNQHASLNNAVALTSKVSDYDQKAKSIEEIIITASRYSLKDSERNSRYAFNTDDLDVLPELGEDAIRAVNYLPGTASNGLSAQPYIRGGSRDETLVLFNKIELLEPFHLKDFQSLFSGLNPNIIKTIDVYTGGFPARYGDKMSGVIDIEPLEDISEQGAEFSLSLLTTSAAAYGSLNNGHGHWVVSARRGNLDWVTAEVNPTLGEPAYSDWYTQLAWDFSPALSLDAGVLAYDDDIMLKELEFDNEYPGQALGESVQSRYENTYGWLQMSYVPSTLYTNSSTLSAGHIRHYRQGSINDPDAAIGMLVDQRRFNIYTLSHQSLYTLNPDLQLDFGGKLSYQHGEYSYQSEVERGSIATLFGLARESQIDITAEPEGFTGGLYFSTRYTANSKISIEAGLRADFQDFGDHDSQLQFSPRISTSWSVAEETQIRASAGRFYQAEGIHELQVSNGISSFQRPQYTDNYIIGLDQSLADSNIHLRAEAFYKYIDKPKRRFENILNAVELLPELMDDRVLLEPSNAKASGIELTLSYHPKPQLKAWFSYSLSKVQEEINGRWQRRIWDQRKAVIGGLVWHHNRWSLSAVARWHTGWQTISLPSHIPAYNPDQVFPQTSLPDFASLDLRVSHTWEWGEQSLVAYFELINALDRENIGGVDAEAEVLDNGSHSIIATEESLLPMVPSFGFQWHFGSP